MSVRRRWWITCIAGLAAVLGGVTAYRFFVNSFTPSLTRGLEEEKSYSRHAMEYHRAHPNKRQGDSVLEVWSDADYIAQLVNQQHPHGEWAQWSDTLSYLPKNLQSRNGRPYCVFNSPEQILVFWFLSNQSGTCDQSSANAAQIAAVQSGDLDFSGRTDNWVYVFRKSVERN